MNIKTKCATVLSMCVLASFVVMPVSFAQNQDKRPTISAAERAVATIEVENVMGREAYYHSASKHRQEWAELWTKRDDITFAENEGWIVGSQKIFNYYVRDDEKAMQRDLDNYRKTHPEVPDSKEFWAVGNFIMHPLTTAVVEIAGDGQTAKGLWYSPGGMLINTGDKVDSVWMWEGVAADFVKEDGQWKIWHLTMYNDFMMPMGMSWEQKVAEDNKNATPSSGPVTGAAPGVSPIVLDVPTRYYEHYSINRKVQMLRAPEPYYTFSETFSYGPFSK